ncbi:MAG: hypothetical protein CML33_04895 [Rhodobacteraceae bacterium]|jgi:hypothetical protein|nr:hypothetical protein [Paracoccaceae bacterium]
MTHPTPPRGGAPVGFLTELPQVEAAAVCFLRHWCESSQTQKQVIQDLNHLLGPTHGPIAIDSLGQMCALFSRFARRPLMRHHSGCSCLGADEACFANLVADATAGHREDAMLFAMLIVRADFAPALTGLAEQFGIALSVLNRNVTSSSSEQVPAEATLH